MFPFLYSPNEPVYFVGFFTSWIRIQEAYLEADPDLDPKYWFDTLFVLFQETCWM